ncbi:MAG: DUF1501 domain-containing protein, partial [Verrucomicrobiales bacterium]|nr:DUF1501 domain-containing protein [Verrucomicrobiales bacterium]
MMSNDYGYLAGGCGGAEHLSRRSLLKGAAGMMWLTPMAELLALDAERGAKLGRPAKSVILLWMAGGASQLETFDPHAGSKIAYGSKAIETAVKGIQVGERLKRTAEVM